MSLPKRKRRTQPESPRWLTPAHDHGGIDLFQVLEYLAATIKHDPPFIGETQTSGGTVNGYIFEQFINGGLNDRTDRYGGTIANRLRFTLETVDAVSAAIGSYLTGIRIAPFGRLQDMHGFDDEQDTWLSLGIELRRRHLAYVHLSDQESLGAQAIPAGFLTKFRETYEGTLIVAGSYTQERAELALREGYADLIAFGRPFIANTDRVKRMKNGWSIAIPDKDTFYAGRDAGYIDYPTYHVD